MDEAKPVKVAVCISGEPRMYNNTYESVLEYFNLLPAKYECDIFIHAWNTTSTARNYQDGLAKDGHCLKHQTAYDIEELRNDLIEKYKPKKILVESKQVLEELVKYYNVKCGADQIMTSNFLAMSQHISAERCANLKMGKDIILPSEKIIGDDSLNDYDMVVKTRFDVMFYPNRSQLGDIWTKIRNFSKPGYERTPTGMTYFPSMTVRDGKLACEFGHYWSNNRQFDMIMTSFFRRIHDSELMNIYTSCHHHVFATHCMRQGTSMREWRKVTNHTPEADPECGRDFIWLMPNAPKGRHCMSVYRRCYKTYAEEHAERMKIVDNKREEADKLIQLEKERVKEGLKLVKKGIKKNVWYCDKVYFVDVDRVKQINGTDVACLDCNTYVEWRTDKKRKSRGHWIECNCQTREKYNSLSCSPV